MRGLIILEIITWAILLVAVVALVVRLLRLRNDYGRLRETETMFRGLVEQSLVGIYLIQDARFLYVNPQFCEIFGYDKHEYLNRLTVPDLVAESDRDKVIENLRRRDSGEIKEAHYHFRGLHKNGSLLEIEVHGLRTQHRGQPAVVGALVDRTELHRAEADLRIRDRALAAIGEGVIISDARQPDFPIIYCNKAFCEITGYPAEEILGQNCRILQGTDRNQPALASIRTALHEGCECREILRNYRRNGQLFWNELSLSPVRNNHGELTHYVGIQRDITTRKQAEQQLQLQSAAIAAAANPIFIIELENHTIQWANEAFSHLYGYTQDEIQGQQPAVLDSGQHAQQHWQSLWETLKAGREWTETTVNRHKTGREITVTEVVTPIINDDGQMTHLVVVHEDITAQLEAQDKLRWMATHDVLTGLPNRAAFKDDLEHELLRSGRSGKLLAVHFIDLDHFKEINDSLGHHVGDEMLKAVARLLANTVRQVDRVARFGGDEFAVLQADADNEENIAQLARRLAEALDQRIEIGDNLLRCGATIGVAVGHADSRITAEKLLEQADIALYSGKKSARGTWVLYSNELGAREHERIRFTEELDRALEQEQFYLVYQPQVDLSNGQITGIEALVRWQHPELGEISPTRFIPVAEESGLIIRLSNWILTEACRQANRWLSAGLLRGTMAVNLSPLQFRERNFPSLVLDVLGKTELDPAVLEFEITESALMEAGQAYRTMEILHGVGVTFSIDDFGTGYSSLLYLKRMPIRRLKIDKEFTLSSPHNRSDAEITRAIIQLAHNLELTAIAEGVETELHAQYVKDMGCDQAQGFYYSPPLSKEECTRLLQAGVLPRDKSES